MRNIQFDKNRIVFFYHLEKEKERNEKISISYQKMSSLLQKLMFGQCEEARALCYKETGGKVSRDVLLAN